MNSVAMSGEVPQTMKPLGLGDSLLYFGVPTVVVTTIYWVVLWVTTTLGVLGYYAHLLALLLGISTLSIGTMLELRREGYAISWQVIKTRLRWRRMTPTAWLWMVMFFLLRRL